MKPNEIDAINSLVPNADYGTSGGKIFWNDERDQPTQSEIDAELKRLEDEYDAQEYARKRQAEYPSIEELVVALYDTDDKADIEAKRAEVKKKYPKP
tara:strand:- start:122 stop:412 length:291 start_codon:yes stop_codon:yes gene_type:complete